MPDHATEQVSQPPFPDRPRHSESCAECGHPLGTHARTVGCVFDWAWNASGIAVVEGCDCHVALADAYDPPTEKDF